MKLEPFRLLGARARGSSRPGKAGRLRTAFSDAVARLGLNDRDFSPRAKAKLLDLIADVERMRAEADRLGARVQELESLADSDPLADTLNRRAFLRELSKMLAFAERHGGPVSVLYIDLDGFKAINDAYGHRAGDAALVHVAGLLRAHLRETDAVGRLGGDEFAAALARADRDQALAKAEDLRTLILECPAIFENTLLPLDASIGVYEANPGDDAETALKAADLAMYACKKAAQGRLGRSRR